MNASSEHSLSDSSEISVSLPAIISTENGDSLSQLTTNKMVPTISCSCVRIAYNIMA